jgi:pantetheine-phosphate adenylyltransferase
MGTTAVYPGTFDPITLEHFDLIERSAALFDGVVVAVAAKSAKPGGLFGIEERLAMVREVVRDMPNVTVDVLDGLLVDYCRKRGVRIVIRGLRAYSDFEYEFQMALTNRKLAPGIETLFMMPQE